MSSERRLLRANREGILSDRELTPAPALEPGQTAPKAQSKVSGTGAAYF